MSSSPPSLPPLPRVRLAFYTEFQIHIIITVIGIVSIAAAATIWMKSLVWCKPEIEFQFFDQLRSHWSSLASLFGTFIVCQSVEIDTNVVIANFQHLAKCSRTKHIHLSVRRTHRHHCRLPLRNNHEVYESSYTRYGYSVIQMLFDFDSSRFSTIQNAFRLHRLLSVVTAAVTTTTTRAAQLTVFWLLCSLHSESETKKLR